MKRGRNGSALHTGLENPKMNKNHPSYQSLIQKFGRIPGGYWHLNWWKGFVDARAIQHILQMVRNCQTSQTQHQQDYKVIDYIGVANDNLDDNDVEDLQSTGDDSIDRLLGLDNMNEEGKSGEIEAWAKVNQDLVGDTVSNEGNTNILIREIED
jgi:hypothetical protein